MNRFDKNASTLAVLLFAVVLTSCSPSPKTTETSSTFSQDEFGNTVKTTTTKELLPSSNPSATNTNTSATSPAGLPPEQVYEEEGTHITVDDDSVRVHEIDSKGVHSSVAEGYSDNSRTHVRAPLVKIDSDERTGRVKVKVPFVNITKNGHGERTTIKLPGITIRGDAD